MSPAVVERRSSRAEIADDALLEAVRAGDEEAFATLVHRYHPRMVRAALFHVRSRAVAEEVAQEAWVRILRGIDGFEGRGPLRAWVFAVLANCARRHAPKEARSVPLTAVAGAGHEPEDDAFFGPEHPRWAGAWKTPVDDWEHVPERRLLAREALETLARAIDELPPLQAAVIRLRDVDGWSAEETRAFLDLTDANQRVLLHRARQAVRRRVAAYLAEG